MQAPPLESLDPIGKQLPLSELEIILLGDEYRCAGLSGTLSFLGLLLYFLLDIGKVQTGCWVRSDTNA